MINADMHSGAMPVRLLTRLGTAQSLISCPLRGRCWQIGWNLTCHDVAEECLALVSGHPRLGKCSIHARVGFETSGLSKFRPGECLQDLGQSCRGRDPTWAADYLLDFRY